MKTKCIRCGAMILSYTASRTSGSCIPCYKSENYDLTPEQRSTLESKGRFDVLRRWMNRPDELPALPRNPELVNRLAHFLPVIEAAIGGALRRVGPANLEKEAQLLDMLRSELADDKDWLRYFDNLDEFINLFSASNAG